MAQRYLIQFSIHYYKKFLNRLRTSCVVSITTVVNWHTWTVDFSTDFEQRVISTAINNWQNDCGAVSKTCVRMLSFSIDSVNAERQHSNTCCNCWYHKTFYYSNRNTVCLKDLPFLFIRQHKLWNDVQLSIATLTCFSWYFATNTTVL